MEAKHRERVVYPVLSQVCGSVQTVRIPLSQILRAQAGDVEAQESIKRYINLYQPDTVKLIEGGAHDGSSSPSMENPEQEEGTTQ